METIVQGELEQVEQQALTASRTGEQHREEAVRAAASHASIALTTLLHVGLITRAEEAEWRQRLDRALGDRKLLAQRGFTITRQGDSPNELSAQAAYSTCRDLSPGLLAWVHHTAATEFAVADALAGGASDPERIRRACELGLADRGKEQVTPHDL